MKQRQEVPRTFAIIVLAVIATCLLLILLAGSAHAQTATLRNYRKLQKSVEYPERIKSNQAFTLKKAKYSLSQAKKRNRKESKESRHQKKVEAIWNRIAQVKQNEQ